MKIKVEDRTEILTNEQLTEAFYIFTDETRKALVALSDNDQKIISQTKDALEEATSKILFLSAKVELLADLLEKVLLKTAEKDTDVKKLSLEEYKQLVTELKSR